MASEHLLHRLIAARAAERPDAVAVAGSGACLTWAELDRRTARLVRHLRALGVGPDVPVAVGVERTPEAVVALLGVLRAGGAYVPLDPAHPRARLAAVVEDSGARLLLTESALAGAMPAAATTVLLDADWPAIAHYETLPTPDETDPDNLAYVLFTSGSTGRPKGVAVSHGALAAALVAMRLQPGIEASDIVPAITTFAFDIAGLELWLPLLAGGRVEVVPRAVAADGSRLAAALAACGATVLQATPATWRLLVAAGWPGDRRLKALCGGEALPPDLAGDLLARAGELWNLYGPTEATIWSAADPVRPGQPIAIGEPLPCASHHLLDRELRPVPHDEIGELAIGGAGVARGYVGRPDLTAERFVPDPFGPPGARLYRTGDLGHALPDGRIEFLGRADAQLKVRGHRVEPGEIEAALRAHPGVADAAVGALPAPSPAGELRLVAWLAIAGEPPVAEALRRHLRDLVPEHMMPSAFVPLPALPTTPSGKVDRRALAALGEHGALVEAAWEPPRTAAEELLARLWAEVLGVERVGRGDAFLDRGGHSLSATQVASRLRDAHGVELPLAAFFEAPTLADLALRLDAALGEESAEPPLVPVLRDGEGELPLSFAQERLWFLDRLAPGTPIYNLATGLRLRGDLDVAALAAALAEVVRRHEALRTTFPEAGGPGDPGGRPRQAIAPPSPPSQQPPPLPLADLGALPGVRAAAETARLAAAEARQPFDLAAGPLLRARLVRVAAAEWLAVVNLHHIVSDGWSTVVLQSELAAAYAALRRGEEPSRALPALPVQVADVAVWQRRRLAGPALAPLLAFWKQALAGAPGALELPADRPRPAVQSFRGARLAGELPAAVVERLRRLGERRRATPFMVVLAALQAFLHRLTGAEDLLVGSAIANRTRTEVERLIGMFVNTLALRGRVAGDLPFDDLVDRARATALAAFAHQDLPFERLVEELAVERTLSHAPLVQVMLAVQNAPGRPPAMPGLAMTPEDIDAGVARFDLGLSVEDTAAGGLALTLEYGADLFDGATARRLLAQLATLLAGVAEDAERMVAALPLLGAAERHQLLVEWSGASRSREAPATAPRLFAERAAVAPEDLALVAGDVRLTYGELARRAAELAARLRALGVGPEARVGLLAGRGVELVVGLLGIWWAGGAYVPLDPEQPAGRLGFMIEDGVAGRAGEPRVLVTDGRRALGDLPVGDVQVVDVDPGPGAPAPGSLQTPPAGAFPKPGDLAYLIYTSGSTGRPKAVMVEHGSLAHTLRAAREAFGFSAADRLPCLAPFSFDIFLFELLGPLLAGGTVELVPLSPVLDVERLAASLDGATLLHAVPALMRQVVAAVRRRPQGGTCPGLRAVFVGGDAVPADLLAEMREAFPAARVHVLYGPTETTIICAGFTVEREVPWHRHPLGRPLPDAVLEVRDDRDGAGRPLPIGVPGELWIGGPGVARGYLHQEALTAERFVVDAGTGGRRYRTGDLARWLPDGGLDFLGRVDQQVKVRGFRVELGEIEAVLAGHPAVREAAVAALRGPDGGIRLAAWVVPRPEAAADEEKSHDHADAHVADWRRLYDETYDAGREVDPTFDVHGWNSSFTGLPIPEAEMREWVDATVARLLELSTRRVLEVGCGTGLLLFRLAPHVERYAANDFSTVAVDLLKSRLHHLGEAAGRVAIEQRAADDWQGAAEGEHDLVILSSVVQYFPSLDYLLRTLEGAARAVAPGGTVFVGDVRSLPLLPAFHAAVELFSAPASLPVARFARRVRRRVADEKELALDPALFSTLAGRLPGLSRVEVRLKPGRHDNEMTRYRYDVLLRFGTPEGPAAPVRAWAETGGLAGVERLLDGERPAAVALAGVPNRRVAAEAAALAILAEEPGVGTVGELRREVEARLADGPEAGAVEPEDLTALAARHGYELEASWLPVGAGDGAPLGAFTALLWRRGEPRPALHAVSGEGVMANDPVRARLARWLVPELKRFLRAEVPEYMVPSAFMLLDALPLSAHGKVDRRALPEPAPAEAVDGSAPPRTPTEEALVAIWRDLLDRERVGTGDDFFEHGGHSLLATQAVSRVRDLLGVELPVRAMFEARTPAALAERIERERELAVRSATPPLVPLPRTTGEPLPLSFAQERLWFIDQLQPGSLYNVPFALRVEGPLDPGLWRRALTELRRRHEALRTSFHAGPAGPVQVVAPAGLWPQPLVDLGALAAPARVAEAERIAAADAARPFDLARGPLLRAMLVRLADREHWALLGFHHIVADGWSTGVMLAEIGRLYEAFAAGEPSPLPEPPVQYADFAVWQREHLRGPVLEGQLDYWRRRLAGLPVLEVPTDRPRGALQSTRGALVPVAVPATSTAALSALALRLEGTLYVALLAAFSALLHRLTGSTDLPVGSPIAGRNRAEVEGLVGFFVNTLVLRLDLSGDPSFAELVARARETALAAYARQDLPFERLVEELRPERRLDRNPLFQVVCNLYRRAPAELRRAGLRLMPFEVHSGTAKFDLDLGLAEAPDGVAGTWEYKTDLFDRATVARLSRCWLALLADAAAHPERRLSALALLGEAERHQVTVEWSDTATAYPREATLDEIFARRAVEVPGAIALAGAGRAMTYGELAGRAEALADRLVALGVGSEVPVALALERSFDLVVAILGVLGAGGFYVPLDPAYPAPRLAAMLAASGAPVVITHRGLTLTTGLPVGDRTVVDLDAPSQPTPAAARRHRLGRAAADNLAYAMFTSGSTGEPKGVAVTHRNVVRLVFGTTFADLGPDETLLQLAPAAFDASTFEIWGALLHGGRLAIAPPGPLSLAELGAAIRGEGVTTLWLTAGLFHQMVDEEPAALAGVRQLLAGGDVVSPAHARRALAGRPGAVLVDGYGPTEGTTFSCCERLTDPATVGAAVPIGRPIANARALVLDAGLRPVPPGVPGELFVGGDGLARGYLGRPDLTAERFVPDPLGEPGARLYATGDLVRSRPDGRLDFLGRVDAQVKVAGYRVEPAEVETALAGHPDVAACAVSTHTGADGDRRLVAWVVPAPGRPLDGAGLRAWLRARLPEPMVPSLVVPLDRLPLTANGKVDRRALPVPDAAAPARPAARPPSPTVELVAGVWADLLGREVGPEESFFDLGGHSLLATRLVARLAALSGVELPLRALFESPTAAGLAALLDGARGNAAPLPAIAPAPRRDGEPLSLAQRRLWLLQQLAPESPFLAISHGLALAGPLDLPALAASLGEVVARHEPLRTTFAVEEEEPMARVTPAAPFPLPAVDLAALSGERREPEALRLALALTERPFDLARGPLLRAALARLGAAEHRLALAVHHLVFDGWSVGVLLAELGALYAAFAARRRPPGSPELPGAPLPSLPPLPLRYADVAAWQRRALAAGAFAGQLAFWRERLRGLPALELPTDRPRPAVQGFAGLWRAVEVPAPLAAALAALCRRRGATLFMALAAAFELLLGRLAGQDDVAVGTPVANRGRRELEGMIGLFVNTLVLRADIADIAGEPSFGGLLDRARATVLAATAHQDLPFESLVEELRPERRLSANPLFQVALSLVEEEPPPALPGLATALWEVDPRVAHFDLTLIATRRPHGLALALNAKRELFDAATASRLLEGLEALLAAAVADPERPAHDLPLAGEASRHQVLREWNDTIADPPAATVDRLVEAWAARAPDALAVADPAERLGYGELVARARRLAGRLRRLGAGPESRVVVCLEPSAALAVAALAALAAGAAYVPLDPAHPAARLAALVAGAGAGVVVTLRRWADRFAGVAARLVLLDAERHELEAEPAERPAGPPNDPSALAYVIFTSGSTGEPKGVEVPHAGLANLVEWHRRRHGLTPADRTTLVASPAFDASVWELWAALTAGASLHVPPREVVVAPRDLAAWLARERITVCFLPTPLAEAVLAAEPPLPEGPALRLLLTGGDRLRRPPAAGLGFTLVNHYGPTETSVVATAGAVAPGGDCREGGDRPPAIGRPIANVEVLLLDPALRPVPMGAVGELAIGGVALARGYAGRPDLTAERFVPHPLGSAVGGPGARLYRTGDLARLRADGALEFLGRRDGQVKVRGFRIELGEVEAALGRHPGVAAAVAAVREGPSGARLVAWFVPRPGGAPSPSLSATELRDHLRARLPEHMVPATLTAVAELPRTDRGKVDLAALPAPEAPRHDGEPPRGELGRAIARLWREALGVERVGEHDNFFDLGGHSLAMAAVRERLRGELGLELPLVALFEHPTIGALVARFGTESNADDRGGEVARRAERQRAAAGWKERTRRARGAGSA